MLIRRPISGGSALGMPFAIAAAPGTTLHTFDNTGTGLGGPFPQNLTLFVQNPTGGTLTATVTINGVGVAHALLTGETWQPFAGQPMIGSGGVVNGTGSAPGLVAWGFIETQT